MALISMDGIAAAVKQAISLKKTASRTTVANSWFSLFELAGSPGGGTLAGTSTTTGTVPTDATAGCPPINAASGNFHIAAVDFGCTVACRLRIYDLLWKAGAYSFNASTSGQTPTSYSSRVPGGTDFNNLEIWVEQVTGATGNQAVSVTYNNQAGTTGQSTGAVGIGAAPTVGRMWQLPLQSGDSGVQGVTGVAGTVASAGTFNILVLRPLWTGRINAANGGDTHGVDRVLLPQIWTDSALIPIICPDSTSSGIVDLELMIAAG